MLDLVFLGPPGAGKGTQAKRVAERLGVPHVSTGDLLRVAVSQGSALGREAKGFMDNGQLVPDPVVDRMVEEKVGSGECAPGFLLDGYPRNVAQARSLDRVEGKLGRALTAVVHLDVPAAVLEGRLSGRRSCPKCGAMYHVQSRPPQTPDRCDACGSTLVVRSDDRAEVVRDRLQVYERETQPLVEYYRAKGLIRDVDGTVGLEEVTGQVLRVLGRA